MKKLAQGAEAVVWDEGNKVVRKERLRKTYRLEAFDALIRKQRTRREARILHKLHSIVRVPRVLEEKDNTLMLEKINGVALKTCLTVEWCRKTGEAVGRMHGAHVIHGDLTTSNVLVEKDGVTLIDFGLSYSSHKLEDFATDVHVFEKIVTPECFDAFWKGYAKTFYDPDHVATRLEKLRARGRYKKTV